MAVPALAPAALIGLSFTPVMLFGCVNRGLLALAIALGSAVGAFVIDDSGMTRPSGPSEPSGRCSLRAIPQR